MMEIEVLVPCVHYADFLALTAPTTRRMFKNVTVITRPDDIASVKVANENGLGVYTTQAWHKDCAAFNKAAALNEYLDVLRSKSYNHWILLLDADILLRDSPGVWFCKLDPRVLYSACRRMCESEEQWNAFVGKSLRWNDFPLYVPDGKGWRHRPTSNPAALCGYFQLWHFDHAVGVHRLPESPTAANYDVEFALSFPDHLRRYIDDCETLHLGLVGTNWFGRVSPIWRRI